MKARAVYLAAALLAAAALTLPLWGFAMSAPQYPDETLHLQVARTGIVGDVHEVSTLQHYIGVRFPTELPELTWATRAIAAFAVLLLVAAFVGAGSFGRIYRTACAVLLLAFLAASAAAVQARLFQVGHERDRNAPIRAVRDFTPPLVGPVRVGNFTVWSFPHAGVVMLLGAAALSIAGARRGGGPVCPPQGRHAGRPLHMLVLLTSVAVPAEARTWIVGGPGADFPFIGPAIAAASAGDTIRVTAGVYREDLVVRKPLKIIGEGAARLIGTGAGTVVTLAAPGCEVTGLAIEGSGTGQTNAMDAAVQVLSNDNRIAGNRLRRVFYGIVVANATRNEIADNEIEGLRDLPFGQRGDGIYLYRAPENVVVRNRISGERDAIYFQYAPRGRAVDNVISDSRYALHDMFSDDAVIERNTFGDSAVGANIMNSRRIRIERNQIRRNRGVPGVGLTLKDCDDSVVRENAIVENARGLLVEGSSANRFTANTFHANDTAVTLFSSAERNTFAGNRFSDNWSDLVLSGRDSGTRWSGNSWSRYRGFDFDGDGIGDAPHLLLGPFERLEGSLPASRLFLQSPAAAGLELAARLSGRAPDDAVDVRPILHPAAPSRVRPSVALFLVPVVVAIMRRVGWTC